MAYATTSARGDVKAQWFDNVSKVVLDVDRNLSVHLSSGEAWALAAQLMAAADQAEVIDTTAA